ncbi:hypothetical protein GW750_06835 [bacterium]|nr:hypothetical protein [bacterium]
MVKQRITLDMSMDDFDKVNKKNPSVLDISMNDLDQNKQTPSVLQGTTDAISDGFSFAPRPRFFADIENKGHRLMDNMTWKS